MARYKLICIVFAIIIFVSFPLKAFADNEVKSDKTAYVLMEMSTGTVISENNQHTAVPVGTMAKLMTVLLAAEKISDGGLSLDDTIKASAAANSMQGAQIWLMPGEEMPLSDMLKGVIIGNANDASVAVAESISDSEESFVEAMNNRAAQLGMNETRFTNCNGYYDDMNQMSSAYDVALLCCELYKYDFLKEYFTCWLDYVRNKETELVNSNVLVKNYNGIVGFKASYTENSENCIAAGAERDGEAYVSVILGYKDKNSMFYDAKQLLNRGFAEYQVLQPKLPEDSPCNIKVKGSYTKSISIEYADIRNIVIPNGTFKNISSYAAIPEYVFAPVKKGDKIGEVHFYQSERFIFSVDVLADGDADNLNIKKAIVILLKFLLSF